MKKTRIPVIAGNWKMNKVRDEALQFIYSVNQELPSPNKVETVICASDVLLRCMVKRQGENLKIGAQNMHFKEFGAFTGETSPKLLETTGVSYVIIGHSERRQMFGETDESVNKKIHAALKYELKPIVCVGETLELREKGLTNVWVKTQVEKAFENISLDDVKQIIIAYEPIWAIGTGKTATPEQAEQTISLIRDVVKELYNEEVADQVRILYGGSVTPNNIDDLLKQSNIDGALVGGASLEAASFLKLVDSAVKNS
ncbi:MAG: triose-phosphate isomerase [Acholeplasmataceae bacterium]|jgi:triosephosphate isomerase|nr:triose-phosphate isomerase [Acholeplasmataceae bacterium]